MTSQPMSSQNEPSDGRHRSRLRRRERVYTAALELFVERGFDGTTMDDIAARAGVVRATVFNHFERKASFIDEWSARRRGRARAATEAAATGRSLREVLAEYLLELAKANESTRDETVAFFGTGTRSTDPVGNTYLAGELAALVAAGADRGEVRPGLDPQTVGLLITGAYFGAIERWVIDPAPFELGDMLLTLLDMIMTGIAAPAA
jgi:AcrR family transcriptional regulator